MFKNFLIGLFLDDHSIYRGGPLQRDLRLSMADLNMNSANNLYLLETEYLRIKPTRSLEHLNVNCRKLKRNKRGPLGIEYLQVLCVARSGH